MKICLTIMCCLALSCTVCLAGQDEQRLYGRLDMLIARQADIEAEKMRHTMMIIINTT